MNHRFITSALFTITCASFVMLEGISTARAQTVREIDLPIYNVASSSQTGLLYATVASSAGAPYGNALIEISATTGEITRHVYVGSEPDPITLAQDGSVAWIGLDGSSRVQAVDLAKMKLGTSFGLGFAGFGPLTASAIAAMPGAPQTIAVSLISTQVEPSFMAATIFDNGIARADSVTAFAGPITIAFGAQPTALYGFNNQDTGFDFFQMSVDAKGASLTSDTPGFFHGFFTKIISDGDTIFTTSGVAADGATLTLLGTYGINDTQAPVALDFATRSVQYASNKGIYVFDRDTFLPTFSADLSSQVQGLNPVSAANCGRACLAVAYNSGQLLIVHDLQNDELFADGFDGKL